MANDYHSSTAYYYDHSITRLETRADLAHVQALIFVCVDMDLHPFIHDNHLAGPTCCSPEVYIFKFKCKLNRATSALSHSTPPRLTALAASQCLDLKVWSHGQVN
eukprot:scaffold114029_cov33-Prasinocladus_malaysianus.AAC.1